MRLASHLYESPVVVRVPLCYTPISLKGDADMKTYHVVFYTESGTAHHSADFATADEMACAVSDWVRFDGRGGHSEVCYC